MFKFVHGFYVHEQGITNLLIALKHAIPTTHWATRQTFWGLLFGARQFNDGWLFPVTATANTNAFVNGRPRAGMHAGYFSGADFGYVNRGHYLEVLEGAFKGTTRWLREKPRANAFAGFYDVLWHYSESFRYRDAAVSPFARQNPFFWNLGVRWIFGSLACVVELWLATIFGTRYTELCRQYQASCQAAAVAACFDGRWTRLEANDFFALCP
jgi:hypothetical protein